MAVGGWIGRAAGAAGAGDGVRIVSCFIVDSVALSAVGGEGGPEHPDSGFKACCFSNAAGGEVDPAAEEDVLPRIPRQQPVDDPPARREDLGGNLHHRVAERA